MMVFTQIALFEKGGGSPDPVAGQWLIKVKLAINDYLV